MYDLICPKCGISNTKKEFIGAFCVDCLPIKLQIPDELAFRICKKCSKIMLHGSWHPFREKDLTKYVLSKCKGEFSDGTFNLETGELVLDVKGKKIIKKIDVNIDSNQCSQCSRISGGYYQAIIQFRGDRKKIEKIAEIMYKKLQKTTFVSKTEEKDEGLDFYVGNSKAVLMIVTDLRLRALITKKLIGRDEGKRLYRTTFAIRI